MSAESALSISDIIAQYRKVDALDEPLIEHRFSLVGFLYLGRHTGDGLLRIA